METDRERNTDRDFSVIGKEGIKFKKNKIKTMKKKKERKETLPFATTWMDLEGIRLREISGQRKTNIS